MISSLPASVSPSLKSPVLLTLWQGLRELSKHTDTEEIITIFSLCVFVTVEDRISIPSASRISGFFSTLTAQFMNWKEWAEFDLQNAFLDFGVIKMFEFTLLTFKCWEILLRVPVLELSLKNQGTGHEWNNKPTWRQARLQLELEAATPLDKALLCSPKVHQAHFNFT
jgi:hypothetical protein